MTTARNKISEILSEAMHTDSESFFGIDEAADAILAALPDMIAPLVWVKSDNQPWRKTAQGCNVKYVIIDWATRHICLDGPNISGFWFMGPDGYVDCLFEQYAVDLANTHYSAAIMTAFKTRPTITP
jgi:hypothetical protein